MCTRTWVQQRYGGERVENDGTGTGLIWAMGTAGACAIGLDSLQEYTTTTGNRVRGEEKSHRDQSDETE